MDDAPDWDSLNPRVIDSFRTHDGEVGGPFQGSPILLLHTVGARSGKSYVSPLTYLPDDDRYVVFASNVGADRHPGWYHNLVANPDVTVEVGVRTVKVHAAVATDAERDQLYSRQVEALSRFGEYQKKTRRTIPAVILTPVPESPRGRTVGDTL